MKIKQPASGAPTTGKRGPKKFEVESSLMVNGIELFTRHGYLDEMKQMIAFAELAASFGVAHYVRQVFYDSVAGMAQFEFHIDPETFDPVWDAVEEVGRLTLRQFCLPGGAVTHGGRQKPTIDKRRQARVTTVHHWRYGQ